MNVAFGKLNIYNHVDLNNSTQRGQYNGIRNFSNILKPSYHNTIPYILRNKIPNFTQKNAFERPFAYYAPIYSAQYALSGYGLFEGFFEYQRYWGITKWVCVLKKLLKTYPYMAIIKFNPEQSKQIQEGIAKMILSLELLNKQLYPTFADLNKKYEAISGSIKKLSELKPNFQEVIKVILEEAPENIKTLADFGWYLPLTSSIFLTYDWAKYIKSKHSGIVDKKMKELLDIHFEELFEEITLFYPHRLKPLEAAFKAHNNEDYFLSIPVFLAQSDGICKEITQNQLFGGKQKKGSKEHFPNTLDWVNSLQNDSKVLDAFLEPLRHKEGLNKHFSKIDNIGFTRHSVLHGENNTYGTEINSYKAMSILFYVSHLVRSMIDQTKE
jgi:hypothetical protein